MKFRSSAFPLALIWLALTVYASLYPFTGWRLPPYDGWGDILGWLWPPKPRYSSPFDRWSNFIAYIPFGFLLAVTWLRARGHPLWALVVPALAGFALSWTMETLQHFLPRRVPSNLDLLLNAIGAIGGAALATILSQHGLLKYWQRWRRLWLAPHNPTGLALLLSWPVALLFPPPLPMGLGNGWSQLQAFLHDKVDGTLFAGWISAPEHAQIVTPEMETMVIALGMLAPCFIALLMARTPTQRITFIATTLTAGLFVTTLSTGLNFAPEHALSWFRSSMLPALVWSVLAAGFMAWWRPWMVTVAGVMALLALIVLVNQAPPDPYLANSLQGWEQGRFIRFHGLAQWVGWLWPYAALVFLAMHLGPAREADDDPTD